MAKYATGHLIKVWEGGNNYHSQVETDLWPDRGPAEPTPVNHRYFS